MAGTWPDDWDARFSGRTCVICEALGRGDSDHWVHVADGACTEVYLDRSSLITGYCIVVWRNGHVAEPTELPADAATAYWQEVLSAGRAVMNAYDPLKLNYLTLGNGVPHLHTHVVPRFAHDPAPGGPLRWDQIAGSPAPAEDSLRSQVEALRLAGLGH